MKKAWIYLLFMFLAIDLTIAFIQYKDLYIDGDLPAIAYPAYWYKEVLEDPTGINTIRTGKPIGGAGRYFAHLTMHKFYHLVPGWLQSFTNPINSVYVASAIFLLCVHFLILWALSSLVTGWNNPFKKENLVIASLLTVLIQYNRLYEVMGLIDHAPTYVFFYIWPTILLVIVYIPFYRWFLGSGNHQISFPIGVAMLTGYIYSSFASPLAAPVCLIWNLILFIALLKPILHRKTTLSTQLNHIARPLGLIIVMSLISLYAYYLSRFNVENVDNNALMTLIERYKLLFDGLKFMFTNSIGYSLLCIGIIVNMVILRNNAEDYFSKYKLLLAAILLFSLIYLLMLPLGGYRVYRPLIIRYDTFIPVTIMTMWIYLHSAWRILNLTVDWRKAYIGFLTIFSLVFFIADLKFPNYASCEKKALNEISHSESQTVILKEQCRTLSWEPIKDPAHSEYPAKMLQIWRITEEEKRFSVQ